MPRPVSRSRSGRRPKKKTAPGWVLLWPLLLGIVVTPFAVRAASVLALSGPSALRILYPYMVLAAAHAQGFSSDQAETLQQWVMYGQFAVYGLIWIVAAQLLRATAGPLSVLLVHAGGVAAAILVAGS